ncbi:hypothetical protein Tco_0290837 [Tanacetum coccineum]
MAATKSFEEGFERLSFQEQLYSKRVLRGPYKTVYLLEELVRNFHGYYFCLVFTKGIQQRTWDPRIEIVQSNTLRTSMEMDMWEIKEKLAERREQIGIRAYEEDKRREEWNQKIKEDKRHEEWNQKIE